MSLKSKIYFSPLFYIIYIISRLRAAFGAKCLVYGYYDKTNKSILKRCRIASTAIITDADKLVIRDNVWVNHYARIDAAGGVTIGEGCQIGYSACILSHSTHNSIRLMGFSYMEFNPDKRLGYISKHTSIGDYTFIGGGSFIMPGVKIGKGCVIGVNSVVTKDIPDYSIAFGSPAKIIGSTRDIDQKFQNHPDFKQYYFES